MALDTNDVDMRARPHSAEEEQFLAACVAGSGIGVSYADLEQAPAVLLAGFEPEDESPIVFLRLRKAVRRHHLQVFSIAALASPGLAKLSGELLATLPGDEAAALTALAAGSAPGRACRGASTGHEAWQRAGQALGAPGAVILVGERLAEVPGALAAAAMLATASGARLAWVPRRAGERGAVEAGALPGLLPIGRPVTDAAARAEVARTWGKSSLPASPGRDTAAMLAAAADGELGALVVAGVDPADLPDPQAALHAIEMAPFVVSLELRASAVTARADVVFPVAAVAEKAGTFVNWEGRGGSFGRRAAGPRGPHRPVRPRRDRRPDGRAPRPARRGGRAGGTRRARHLARPASRAARGRPGPGPACRRPTTSRAPACSTSGWRRGASCWTAGDARRRAVARGHRPAGGGQDVRGHRGRGRRGRRR